MKKYVNLFTPVKAKPPIFTELVHAQGHYVQMLYRISQKKGQSTWKVQTEIH